MKISYDRWNEWLEQIKADAKHLVLSRHMYLDIHHLIRSNQALHRTDYFHTYLHNTYIAHVATTLRRNLRSKKQSVSLLGLLESIQSEASLVTAKALEEFYDGGGRESFARSDFEQELGRSGGRLLPEDVQKDIDRLRSHATQCADFFDQRIAHYDKKLSAPPPTFNHTHEAIDAVVEITAKYVFLLSGLRWTVPRPTVGKEWLTIFDTAWRAP